MSDTERPKFMTITVFNDEDLSCRVEFHGGRMVAEASPIMIMEGVVMAMMQTFKKAIKDGGVELGEQTHLN